MRGSDRIGELESSVLSLEKQHKVVRLKDNYDTKHCIDFVLTLYFSLHSAELMVDCWCSRSQARKLQLLQLCGVWSRQRNFPSSSFVSPTGKCLNIKPPLKSPKLLGYQHPPSPNMQWLFVHHSHSINLYCDYL